MSQKYKADQGDCVASIAFANGHLWETIWQDSTNEELRDNRTEAHILLPGDVVSIPDIQPKQALRAIDQRHTFKRKGVPEYLNLQLLDAGMPRTGLQYTVAIDDEAPVEGTTDGDGMIKLPISPAAKMAKLRISDVECYEIQLGYLDPASTESGARQRLVNLGLLGSSDAPREAFENALADFKDRYQLTSSSELLDSDTQQRLKEIHGC